MRDYQTKANAGGAPDSITSTKLGAGEVNSILTENENAVSRAGLTLANAAGAGEDTTQLAQSLFIHAVKSSSFADSGSANAYQLTPVSGSNGVLLPGNYTTLDGARIYFVPGNNNTGNTTINIGQTVGTLLGAKKALTQAGAELPAGALSTSFMAAFTYDASADSGNGAWILDGSYDASGQFLPLTGGTMTGPIAMGNNKVTGLANGTATGDAVNKGQLDLKLNITGGTMSGAIAMGSQKITGLANGTASGDAVNKGQLDAATPDASTSVKGLIQILTNAQFNTGTDGNRAVVVSNFVKSIGASGYIGLPGGLILQWGLTGNISNTGTVTVTLPISLTTGGYSIVALHRNSGASSASRSAWGEFLSLTQIELGQNNSGGSALQLFWFALGR